MESGRSSQDLPKRSLSFFKTTLTLGTFHDVSHPSERSSALEERIVQSVRDELLRLIETRTAQIGVVGLGYVGLPLALALAEAGFATIGFEIDEAKARAVNEGHSYIGDISSADIFKQLASRRFRATTDFKRLDGCDCIILCVPTPLSRTNDPDLSYIETATAQVRGTLRRGQLIVLESTTYPGCTEELMLPALRNSGLELDSDFLLAFSPERVDPGNHDFTTEGIPRIVGGCSPDSTDVAAALYRCAVPAVHVVSSARAAETAKLLENTFRAVNIGLVNELALMCYQMNIDIWEVIEAAKTKPYGFMPFYPGPGIGGHCIPLDPAYLSWRGRQFGLESRFIDVAQQINGAMPGYVVQLVADALNARGKAVNGANVLLLGVTYKKDVGDVRESPAIEIIEELRVKRARVSYYDPFVPRIDFSKMQSKLRRDMMYSGSERRSRPSVLRSAEKPQHGRRISDPISSVELTDEVLKQADCVVIVTDHSSVDYQRVADRASLIVDTRNAMKEHVRGQNRTQIVRL